MLAKSVLVVVAVKTRNFFVLTRARFKVLFYDCNKQDATLKHIRTSVGVIGISSGT